MPITIYIKRFLPAFVAFFSLNATHAATSPLWSFTPLTPTILSIPLGASATVQYQITNLSPKTHTLMLMPVNGITQITTAGNCPRSFTLGTQQSCILNLLITANLLQHNIHNGPIVCHQGNPLQCYQPSVSNRLNIQIVS